MSKKRGIIIYLSIFAIVLIAVQVGGDLQRKHVNNEIDKNLGLTIGSISRVSIRFQKLDDIYYCFKVDGKEYCSSIQYGDGNEIQVHQFYKIKYSQLDPEVNRILLDTMYNIDEARKLITKYKKAGLTK